MDRGPLRRACVVACLVAVGTVTGSTQASAESCTGDTASTVSRQVVPFGAAIVAPTAQSTDNFGQTVISPEATTDC